MLTIVENSISIDEYLYLREQVGWAALTDRQAQLALDNCLYSVKAVDENGYLEKVVERTRIEKVDDGIAFTEDDGATWEMLHEDTIVSMNMWGFKPSFFGLLEKGFVEFLSGLKEGDIKSEYLLPIYIDALIKKGEAKVSLLETQEKWFGMTYKEDLESVRESIKKLIEENVYPEKLYE
jgi:hypothetical protein